MPASPPPAFRIDMSDAPDAADKETLTRQIVAYNIAMLGPTEGRPLVLLIRAPDGEVLGGLWARTGFRWLFVELLFVPEALRGQAIGSALLRQAEDEARARGCIGAWLDTLSQAAGAFYEKRGYKVFGRIDDYPSGNARLFLSRPLQDQAPPIV